MCVENCSGSFIQEAFVFVAGLLIVFTNSGARSLAGINFVFSLVEKLVLEHSKVEV